MSQVLSALARKGLEGPEPHSRTRTGVPLLPRRRAGAPRPTLKLINQLRDDTKRGRLATFDRTIPFKAVRGASVASLEVVEPAE